MSKIAAIDNGNSTSMGRSDEARDVITFETVCAPRTNKRSLNAEDGAPTFTLRDAHEQVYVYGLDDVQSWGVLEQQRRFNAQERYGSQDWLDYIKVQLLHLFAAHRGSSTAISPVLSVSVPLAIWNDEVRVREVTQRVCSISTIEDAQGCKLRLALTPKKVSIRPEAGDQIFNFITDPFTLKPRSTVQRVDARAEDKPSLLGASLNIDFGYGTCNTSYFINGKFQPNRAYTLENSGFRVVVAKLAEELRKSVRAVDESYLERSLRSIAGKPLFDKKLKKTIEVAPNFFAEVATLYDVEVSNLAKRVVNGVLTRYAEPPSRIIMSGGGAYHMARAIAKELAAVKFTAEVFMMPDAEYANVHGMFIALSKAAQRAG